MSEYLNNCDHILMVHKIPINNSKSPLIMSNNKILYVQSYCYLNSPHLWMLPGMPALCRRRSYERSDPHDATETGSRSKHREWNEWHLSVGKGEICTSEAAQYATNQASHEESIEEWLSSSLCLTEYTSHFPLPSRGSLLHFLLWREQLWRHGAPSGCFLLRTATLCPSFTRSLVTSSRVIHLFFLMFSK